MPPRKRGRRGYSDPTLAAFNELFYTYRRNAKRDGKRFDLTKKQFRRLTKQNCHYCNRPPDRPFDRVRYRAPYHYSGIDKLDPSGHYTLSNVVTSCFECNQRKSKSCYQDFIQSILRIAAHQMTKFKPKPPRKP